MTLTTLWASEGKLHDVVQGFANILQNTVIISWDNGCNTLATGPAQSWHSIDIMMSFNVIHSMWSFQMKEKCTVLCISSWCYHNSMGIHCLTNQRPTCVSLKSVKRESNFSKSHGHSIHFLYSWCLITIKGFILSLLNSIKTNIYFIIWWD